MDIREQMRRLVRIQALASEMLGARQVLGTAPGRIEEIESRFRERNAEYVAVRDRYEEIERDQNGRESRVAELEEQRKKFKNDLMQVKNQREYTVVLQEIDTVTSEISAHEDSALKNMEELEGLKGELATHEEHIASERKRVEQECADVNAAVEEANGLIARLGRERETFEKGVPPALLTSVRQLEGARQGLFLAKVDNGSCSACFVRVRPQVVQEIKRASKLHACSSCRRYLYHERLVEAPHDGPEPDAASEAAPAV